MAKNKFRYFNVFYWWRKFTFSSTFQNLWLSKKTNKREAVFNSIYKSYHWKDYYKPEKDESYSGFGSDKHLGDNVVTSLKNFIENNKVEKILDLACGDFNWMKEIVLNNNSINYTGYEIVDSIIKSNNRLYSNEKIVFKRVDIIENSLTEKFDLIIIKDLFQHIKNDEILLILNKLKSNKSKFLAITTNPDIESNVDLKNFGHHRYINIENKPFMLNKPFLSFTANKNEKYLKKINIYNLQNLNIL